MTYGEIRSIVQRLSWYETVVAREFVRACQLEPEVRIYGADDEDEPDPRIVRLMRQRYGALDRVR